MATPYPNNHRGISMSSDLVVKSNRLITAIQNLSLSEARLVQLGIIDARERNEGLSSDVPLRIDAMRYAKAFGVSKQTAYEVLLSAESALFERRFTFLDEKDNKVKSRWISQVKYVKGEGAIEIIFTPAVVNEISRINGIEKFFTKYALEQVSELTSVYSIRLYELLTQWRKTKKTPIFELEEFRGQLGLGVNEYSQMCGFKRRVLDSSVDEINEKTDLKIAYSQKKKGRKIVGFTFTVKDKKESSKNKGNTELKEFKPLTASQINFFGSKLAHDSQFAKNAKTGESMASFESRIKENLSDPKYQIKWSNDLIRVGYTPR